VRVCKDRSAASPHVLGLLPVDACARQFGDDDEVMLDRFLLRVDCGTYVEDSMAFSKINLGSFL
jgi:hypothetical protein